jgi:hypothetical protein
MRSRFDPITFTGVVMMFASAKVNRESQNRRPDHVLTFGGVVMMFASAKGEPRIAESQA